MQPAGLLLCAGEIVITPPLLDEVTRGKLPGVLRRNCFVSLATNVRMKHRGGEEVYTQDKHHLCI